MTRYADIVAVRDALYEADAITMKGVRILNQFPTISPDEVRGDVHCGECRYAERRFPVGIRTEIFCKLFCAGMKAHDYCSYGAKMMEVREDA